MAKKAKLTVKPTSEPDWASKAGHLLYLKLLVDKGNRTEAAKSIGMPYNTMSDKLNKAAKAFKKKLYEPNADKTKTRKNIIHQDIKTLVYQCRPYLDGLNAEMAKTNLAIRIGVTHYAARNYLDVLAKASNRTIEGNSAWKKRGDKTNTLYVGNATELLDKLKRHEIDLMFGAISEEDQGLKSYNAGEIQYRVVISRALSGDRLFAKFVGFENDNWIYLKTGNAWQKLLTHDRWAVNAPGTITRKRLDSMANSIGLSNEAWTVKHLVESADEDVLLNVVALFPGAVAVLPWGPELERKAEALKAKVAVLPLPDSKQMAPVHVGATIRLDAPERLQQLATRILVHFTRALEPKLQAE